MRTAMVSGTFDPVTLGHVDLAERASRLFDQVIMTMMINPNKHDRFPVEQRLAFLRDAVAHLPNVRVDFWDGMLYEYVLAHGICANVRGIRSEKDAAYELDMAEYNLAHAPSCETLLLPAKKGLEQLSSTEVMRRSRAGEDISALVTPMVAQALQTDKKGEVSYGRDSH